MAAENDIVLIHFEDQPLSFARIEAILPDSKPDWYHVKLLMLQVPLQVVTWILREEYINGEPFTMGGKDMKIEKVRVDLPGRTTPGGDQAGSGSKRSEKSQKVVTLKKQH